MQKSSTLLKDTKGEALRSAPDPDQVNARRPSVQRLHRAMGNQTFGRLLRNGRLQARLRVSQPDDPSEAQADQVARQVMAMPQAGPATRDGAQATDERAPQSEPTTIAPLARGGEPAASESFELRESDNDTPSGIGVEQRLTSSQGGGQPLPGDVRDYMEPRFGVDFSQVRVHTDPDAVRMNRALHAEAFTHNRDIYFGDGRAPGNDALTAHELTHVVQQTGAGPGGSVEIPGVQRVVEVRRPGRGEASAFDRVDELIDRLNGLSPAIQYRFEGGENRGRIEYDVVDEAALTAFDRQMRAFIDRAEVVPMRLITGAGRVDGQALLVDSYNLAYVDLDDMLASDDISFQMNLVHLLAERFRVRNYARRIGTAGMPGFGPEFNRAHRAGIDAETELLRDVLTDPTIRFTSEFQRPGNTLVFMFRSNEGYVVFHIFRGTQRSEIGGTLSVLTADGRRISLEDFLAERAAAAAPAAAVP
jgi:hypothetical protein